MSYKERFIDAIVKHSVAEDWSGCKSEWKYVGSYEQPHSNCLCGQSITEVCVIRNRFTDFRLEVGNKCVQKFMYDDREMEWKLLYKNKIDDDLLNTLKTSNVLSEWETKFYKDVKNKRKLSIKQSNRIVDILEKSKKWINI